LDAVYRLACHLARSSQEAEDFVQETYLRAFRSASSFKLGEHGIRPWLFKILHNVIYASASQQQRERSAIEGRQHENGGNVESGAPPSEYRGDRLLHARLGARRSAAKGRHHGIGLAVPHLLPAVGRRGLKYREIAEVTDVPVGTVMSRLARGRAILAARLLELGAEHGFKPGELSSPAEKKRSPPKKIKRPRATTLHSDQSHGRRIGDENFPPEADGVCRRGTRPAANAGGCWTT